MSPKQPQQANILRELGDGLVLRRSTAGDAEALSDFNSRLHSDDGPDKPDVRIAAWTRDLLTRPHPTFGAEDFTLVEEIATGKIVSSLNLISQTWTYAGIPFKVGRPELVGTLEEYRNRGLVRAQFDAVHALSAERGELVQGITGIPYYYRLFGYEMALNLGGGRVGYLPHVPRLKEGESEPYHVRPASLQDIPLIKEMYEQASRRSLVSCVWDDALWEYELTGKSEENVNRIVLKVIETVEGEPVAALGHHASPWGTMMASNFFEVRPGVSWAAAAPTAIRALQAAGQESLASTPEKTFESFGFWMGTQHPVYEVLHDQLPRVRKPYAWFMRVPDLPAFLQVIAPALEARLAASPMQSHTGQLKLTFYNRGLLLDFQAGRLAKVEAWKPAPVGHAGDAAFPELTFLQILFGYRSRDELSYAFPDVWYKDNTTFALIEALFPKQFSNVMPVS